VDPERPAPRNLPQTIGRYRILGRLGKGAMGVVYSAHDGLMERSVAIKVMMTDLEDDPETSARFYREARSAGQLAHPNIITIYDMGEDSGRPFIVMELLEGETLNKYLERPEAADVESKMDLMLQICRGLHAAHSRGIFHRDIKPGNLLVRPNGELKIVDFGIARLASSSMTASGLLVGTPDYMSPEQARGHEIDQRSDIFSAGAVFYYMLTGRKPFAASGLTAVLAKVQAEDPLPVRDSEAPAPLARVIMKALAKTPADRQQTCGQMGTELERVKRDLELEAAQSIEHVDVRLQSLASLADQRRNLVDALRLVPTPADLDVTRLSLIERRTSVTEPYRVKAAGELLAAVADVQKKSLEEVDTWQRALDAVEEGVRAAAAGRKRDAIAHFEIALQVEPAAKRAAAEADVCRRTIAEQRALDDQTGALLAEARKAAAAKQWQAAIALCREALALDGRADDARTLQRTALEALEAETVERRTQCERALARAETYLRKKRFEDATLELARARELDPDAAELRAFEDRLRDSAAESARQTQSAREAADAIAAARRTFSQGHRDQAVADLRSFCARVPEAVVAVEIGRLEAEAKRIEAAEQRAGEAADHATAAEAALAAGDPQSAQVRATRALAIAPGHPIARRIAGLAAAEVKRHADATARAATASRHLEEAGQQSARGKFQKARALVSTAADLDPANSHHKLVLARIQEDEARAAADAERERLAKQREKAVAPILERARDAETEGDFVRAAWTAENALAIDLNCAEAKAILGRATAQLQAQPALAEKTVDLTGATGESGDPDDTVSLTRPAGVWGRVTGVVRSWIHRDERVTREKPSGPASKPDKTLAR
jgi:tetratricopeptide (TPR) repeat protein/predicted Ser/Thr protein kinase